MRLLLWIQPGALRGGSVSVWRDDDALRRFLRLPRHGLVIRRHTDRIDVWSTEWTQRLTGPDQVKRAVRPVLAGDRKSVV